MVLVIQLTACRGRLNTCTDCCSRVFKSCTNIHTSCNQVSLLTNILAETPLGSSITTYSATSTPTSYILLRSPSKDNPWNEVPIFHFGLKSVVFPQSCGMLQAKFNSIMEPKSDMAKPRNKTSRNHLRFQKFFHAFTSVQSSPIPVY